MAKGWSDKAREASAKSRSNSKAPMDKKTRALQTQIDQYRSETKGKRKRLSGESRNSRPSYTKGWQ